MATILGMLLGMSFLGFRYYRSRYIDIKSKYDEVDGVNLSNAKIEIDTLTKRCDELKKENDYLNKDKKDKKRRKGLYKKTLAYAEDEKKLFFEAEIIEVDRAKGKSKIKVVHINCNEPLDNKQRGQAKELMEGWVDVSDIEWFERPQDEIRTDKIDNILENETE